MLHLRRFGGSLAQPTSSLHGTRAGRVLGSLAVVTVVLGGLLVASAGPAAAAPKPKPKPACADRIDNDGDGLVDYKRSGGDPDCTSREDDSEAALFECTDADGDGLYETPPLIPNGTAGCDLFTGEVHLLACNVNYWDLNGIVADGCEYGPVPFTGPEECDNVDNDADGLVDEELVPPTVPNGWATCQAGVWVLMCNPGFSDANGEFGDGCEATEPA